MSAPNADTLYSVAWLDVGTEPMVFSHPDMGKRYLPVPDVQPVDAGDRSPGKRTAGGKAATYLHHWPRLEGRGAGRHEADQVADHATCVILGRTYADGTEEDYKAVNALQAQYKLVPLSAYGKPYTYMAPPVDPNPGFSMTDKPQAVIDAMDTSAYFNMMARLMGGCCAARGGRRADRREDGQDRPRARQAVRHGQARSGGAGRAEGHAARRRPRRSSPEADIRHEASTAGSFPPRPGPTALTICSARFIAAFGWPANLPQDAVYPYAAKDGDGQTLSGANKYTLTFPKGQTPPVDGFWSITMYFDDGGLWFYPNPLNKFTVSMRDKPKFNDDGSLTLYFQHESPGKDKEANWLPAPKGEFILMMRMYWPKDKAPSILPSGKGTWTIPPVKKVE